MSRNKFYLLLAEDDRDDQDLIIELVGQIDRDWKVYCAYNGLQVIEFLQRISVNHYPHLLLLDYSMPYLNGEEVLERLKGHEDFERIYKVMLTSAAWADRGRRWLTIGAARHLVKPAKASELKQILREILCSVKANLSDLGQVDPIE